ncbi:MAG TPA: hypothetical protein EYQ24_17840 [Bacteroidetes bacterium]|nr:hypothetical protein [Bacteroidota bacterium]HIL57377.1 hypothetical protein [Rhodothermales bacterium]
MTFRSVHHPGSASRALVAARAQAGPVAFALLCVMIVALAAALQGYPVLRPLMLIVPGVYACAAAVGMYVVQRRPAEVVVAGASGAIRSVWEVSGDGPALLVPVHSAMPRREGLVVGIGDEVITLRPEDWPQLEDVHRALAEAARRADLERGPVSWT